MNYTLDLNDRPFKAIKAGSKKIEGRVRTSWDQTPYGDLRSGDTITFKNNTTDEVMTVDILAIRHYPDARSMLETEGTRNVLSSGGNAEEGIEGYNSFEEYKENILKYGIYAIELALKSEASGAIVRTGAKALIRKENTFLILKKTEKGTDPLVGWETPGGHMSAADESLDSCLDREIAEETGLEVKVLCQFATFTIKDSAGTFVGVNFLCDYVNGEVRLDPNEHHDFRWATIEEIQTLTSSSGLQKEINKYLEYLKTIQNK